MALITFTVMGSVLSRNSLHKVALACQGGCGYWDDFRNPGPELRNARIYPLRKGQTVDGLMRPNRPVCGIGTCDGVSHRALASSGCWKNEP